MKILLVHNYYRSGAPSGENQVFEAERTLLLARGHEVETLTRQSDEIRAQGAWGTLKGALATPWNFWMACAARRAVSNFQPDVVHVHNTFPLISPSIFHAIGGAAATALTLHNYRLFCPAAIPMRAGRVCTECLERQHGWRAIRHGCYRGSRLATAPLAMSVGLHRGLKTWERQVDAFIALSEFQRELMAGSGLPLEKVHVKPNFFPGNPPIVPWAHRQRYAVFVGRLSAEKGVATLLRAWRQWGDSAPQLRVVGDGEMRGRLTEMAAGLPVRFLGQVGSAEAQAAIAGACLLVLPSEWFEGFPMVVREAFAFGTPVAVSNLGPLPSIVKHGESGVVFKAGDPASLFKEVSVAWNTEDLLARMGQRARAEFDSKYTEDANYQRLMEIYGKAMTVLLGKRGG